MDTVTIVLFIVGIIALVAGAEALVRGASRLAISVGISPLVVGLTVVAIGTSSPEIAVSVKAALAGSGDISLGNVIGSNIANVLLILGVGALICPMAVSRRLVRIDVPVMIGVSALLLLLAADKTVSRLDGLLLLVGTAAYLFFSIREGRKEGKACDAVDAPAGKRDGGWPTQVALVIGGLALLVIGSNWLVNGAVAFARILGLSELVIGLTIIAVGTSLPEAATSVIAALRKEQDIAVGNVVGSNTLNILAVLGLAAVVSPEPLRVAAAALRFDIPVMLAAAAACLPVFFIGGSISRWEGALFLGYYAAYTLYLILLSASHDALPAFSWTMEVFVIPLTVVTLAVLAARAFRAERRARM